NSIDLHAGWLTQQCKEEKVPWRGFDRCSSRFSAAPWLIKIQQLTEEAMKPILSKLLGRAGDLLDVQPVLALFLAGAFLAVFLTALFVPKSTAEPDARASLLWTLHRQCATLVWAV